jgi:type I restriction enzyme S subunit
MTTDKKHWTKKRLGDVLDLRYGKGLPKRVRDSGSYPVFGSGGVIDYHSEYLIEGPGIIVGRKGSIGTVYYTKENFWPIDTVFYVDLDDRRHNLWFVYYMLLQFNLDKLNSDAAVPGLNRQIAVSQSCMIPPLPTQRKIAAILSAYDDLIENNTRRIAILEEMAQLLYREWFVHFRFPGHEDVARVEFAPERPSASVSPVSGLIPEDWKVKRLEDVCHLTLGVSPRSEYYNEDGEGLPFHQGVSDFGRLYPITRRYCSKIKRTADPGDILFSVRAPVGRLNIADRKIVIGRGLHAIRSKAENQSFIFLQLSEKFKEEDSVGSGTIFKSVTKSDMLGIELLIPPPELVQRFERVVDPMYSEIKSLTDRNNVLRRARDLLLPRIVSGALDVADLPIDVAQNAFND